MPDLTVGQSANGKVGSGVAKPGVQVSMPDPVVGQSASGKTGSG